LYFVLKLSVSFVFSCAASEYERETLEILKPVKKLNKHYRGIPGVNVTFSIRVRQARRYSY
jgi:hypothetical protein